MKTRTHILRITMAALFAAIVTVATMIVQIPSPMNGYVNLGDCFVILSAWILGPVYGTVAAAMGSMLADLFSGYVAYALATFIIKGLMGLAAWGVIKVFTSSKRSATWRLLIRCVSAVTAEAIMVAGYFIWAALIFGEGLAAAASVPGNLVQAAIAIPASVIIMAALEKTGAVK